jgi:hypothetical protein
MERMLLFAIEGQKCRFDYGMDPRQESIPKRLQRIKSPSNLRCTAEKAARRCKI